MKVNKKIEYTIREGPVYVSNPTNICGVQIFVVGAYGTDSKTITVNYSDAEKISKALIKLLELIEEENVVQT